MRYAIVESGGKQYKAVEGQTIDVDRLADEAGNEIDLRILMMADGDEIVVGTPTAGGLHVKATVLDHIRGNKVVRFKYSPKKRIRVRGGHRQQYTRLRVDFIGKEGETRKAEKVEPIVETPVETKAETPKARKTATKKAPAKKTAAASKSVTKSTAKKTTKSSVR